MLRRWLGPIDGLLRTLVAFTTYFVVRFLESLMPSGIPFLLGETIAVLVGLIVSGVASTHVWALPRFSVEMELGGRPVPGNVLNLSFSSPSSERLVVHHVKRSNPSLLSAWVLRKLYAEGLEISLSTTARVFRTTRDSGSISKIVRRDDGFSFIVPSNGVDGLIGTIRVRWQPLGPAMAVRCPVEHALVTSSSRHKWLLRLVLLDAQVDQVELRV